MISSELLEKLLKKFERYYFIKRKSDNVSNYELNNEKASQESESYNQNINIENQDPEHQDIKDGDSDSNHNVTLPFSAEAEFKSHTEQYFLVRAAKLSEIDSHEYVFFHSSENLNLQTLLQLDKIAWETGISRVKPSFNHRNTDISLVLISDKIENDAFNQIKKLKHSKSYMFSLKGWSNFRVIALETSSNRVTYNRLGKDLKKTIEAI